MTSRLLSRHTIGLLTPVLVLCGISLLTMQALFSSDPFHVLSRAAIKQGGFVVVGLGLIWLLLAIGYQRVGRLAAILFVGSIGLLVLVQVGKYAGFSFVPYRKGAWRWIDVGPVQFQPSETMKIAYVLALAWYLKYRRSYRTLGGLVAPFIITLIPMALILVQPDLGTVLLFLPVLFAMLFAAGAKIKHLVIIILLGILCVPFFWMKIHEYQRLRLVGMVLQNAQIRLYFTEHPDRWDWFRPPTKKGDPKNAAEEWRNQLTRWETNTGFHLVRGKAAIGSGGMFGMGWADGPFVEDDLLLPERENDFIFAMIANQWGFVGGLVVLGCYVLFVVFGLDVATSTRDPFGRLVAVGITTLIAMQAFTNICMTVGIGPVTGVTLPFLSQGGSSLISCFTCLGLLMSVAYHRPIIMANDAFRFNEEAERYGAVR